MKTNKEVWIKRFQDWENSGSTRADYCRKHQIPVSTFDYWRQRIRKESNNKDRDSGLVKLPPVPSQIMTADFTKLKVYENRWITACPLAGSKLPARVCIQTQIKAVKNLTLTIW